MPVSPKHICRGSIALQIAQGNHAVYGTDGPIRRTAAIVCLHAPLRRARLWSSQKVEQGRRVEEVNHYLQQCWHVRRWRRLSDEGGMDAEWAANSYLDNCLDVGGEKHPLTVDMTLRRDRGAVDRLTRMTVALDGPPTDATRAAAASGIPRSWIRPNQGRHSNR